MIPIAIYLLFPLLPDHDLKLPPTHLNIEGRVRIPLIQGPRKNALYVRGAIGTETVTFLIDTGANNSYLDFSLAKRLRLKLEPTEDTVNVDGVKHQTDRTEVFDFRLGPDVRREKMTFAVHNMTANIELHKEKFGIEYHGIIGDNFLRAYSALIDYRTSSLYLADPSAWDLRVMQGSWRAVGGEWLGAPITDPEFLSHGRAKLTGKEFEFEHDGVSYSGTLHLNGFHRPKLFGVTGIKLNGKALATETLLGLYEVNRTQLRLMLPVKDPFPRRAEDMPATFKTSDKNGMAIFTFERVGAPRVLAPPPRAARP
jgi:hypothetical protein